MTSADNTELLRPGVAAKRLGVSTRTLADWADAGVIAAVVTAGGHRRYWATDIDTITLQARAAAATEESSTPTPSSPLPAARTFGSRARRGRALTETEIATLTAATTIRAWAELAAHCQANGSSIRQIAAATGTLPATVAARITRHNPAKKAGT